MLNCVAGGFSWILTVDCGLRREQVHVLEVIFWEAPSAELGNSKKDGRLKLKEKRRKGERPL